MAKVADLLGNLNIFKNQKSIPTQVGRTCRSAQTSAEPAQQSSAFAFLDSSSRIAPLRLQPSLAHLAANGAILKRLAEIDKTLLEHDSALRTVWKKLQPLLQPPPDPPKRRIGFNRDKEA